MDLIQLDNDSYIRLDNNILDKLRYVYNLNKDSLERYNISFNKFCNSAISMGAKDIADIFQKSFEKSHHIDWEETAKLFEFMEKRMPELFKMMEV